VDSSIFYDGFSELLPLRPGGVLALINRPNTVSCLYSTAPLRHTGFQLAFILQCFILHIMTSPLLEALLESPELPELLERGQRTLILEQKLRQKFYKDITPEHKWEFIQGQVIMHSPVLNRHLMATQRTYDLISGYVRVRNFGIVRVEKAMTSFPRNDYEPDVMFFGQAKAALIDPDTLKFPIPDLIVEVLSPSTESRDRGIKFQDYAVHGVGEYWIVDPVAESVEVFHLDGRGYPPVEKQTDGMLVSEVITGFEVPVRALFDETENLAALRMILGQ
jgi:Uma2 family endonuclease